MPRPPSLKHRVSTRLAWLGISHKDYANIIEMDKGGLSRTLRGRIPGDRILARIATGLGMTTEQLLDVDDRAILVADHPAFDVELLFDDEASSKRIRAMQDWYRSQDLDAPSNHHRPPSEVESRRQAVLEVLENGTFSAEMVGELAERFGVSKGLIYNDRTMLVKRGITP